MEEIKSSESIQVTQMDEQDEENVVVRMLVSFNCIFDVRSDPFPLAFFVVIDPIPNDPIQTTINFVRKYSNPYHAMPLTPDSEQNEYQFVVCLVFSPPHYTNFYLFS